MAEPLDLERRLRALAITVDRDLRIDERANVIVDRVVQQIGAGTGNSASDRARAGDRARADGDSPGPITGGGPWRRDDRRFTAHSGRRLALAAAVVVAIIAASLVVSPRARRAVADLLGVRGVRIVRVPPSTTATTIAGTIDGAVATTDATASASASTSTSTSTSTLPGPPVDAAGLDALGLGQRFVSVTAAAAAVSFPLSTLDPASVGPAVGTFVHRPPSSGVVTIAYQPRGEALVLLSQLPATIDTSVFKKLAGGDTTIEPVEVNGSSGYWISGDVHVIYYIDDSGREVVDDARLAGPTLLWSAGPVTYRIEGGASKERALALATTLRPAS